MILVRSFVESCSCVIKSFFFFSCSCYCSCVILDFLNFILDILEFVYLEVIYKKKKLKTHIVGNYKRELSDKRQYL